MRKRHEDVKRAVAVKTIEGDAPYDRNLYIQQARFYGSRSIEDILMAGKFLLVLQEKEGYGEFIKLVEEEVGMPHSTAYRFMNVALKAEAYPRINFSHVGKVGHVYALLEAPEEDLKELEEKGVLAGHDMDELQAMSVKEMRELIKKLKAGAEKIIGKEVKKLEASNNAQAAEIRKLTAKIPVTEPKKFNEAWETGEKLAGDAIDIFLNLKLKKVVSADPALKVKYAAKIKTLKKRFDGLHDIMLEGIS